MRRVIERSAAALRGVCPPFKGLARFSPPCREPNPARVLDVRAVIHRPAVPFYSYFGKPLHWLCTPRAAEAETRPHFSSRRVRKTEA